jgi:trimethylamine--corrinoid protein Co-methyltransferase
MRDKTAFVHAKSLELLREVGVRIRHQGALDRLRAHGFKVDGDLVRFESAPLMELVALAPKGFVMAAPDPVFDLPINGTEVNYSPGYGCASITEIDGTVRDSTIEDYKTFLKLIEASDLFKINGGIVCQPQDLPAPLSWAGMTYMTIVHSNKVIFGQPGEESQVRRVMDLAAMAAGSVEALKARPRVMTMMSTLSPLTIDKSTVETCIVCGELRQPIMVSPGPMAGATGPINLQANIVMGNAEILASLAFIQLFHPGTPVMYGLQATTTDMRTGGISIGSPGYPLQAKYCKAMADFYGLPCRCGGTVNDARELSFQSAYESFLPILTTSLAKVDLIVHSNGILNSFASMSFEKFIVDLEIISLIRYYLADLEFGDDTVDIGLFKEVGPGGLFLNHRDTLAKCRRIPWSPSVSHRGPLPPGVTFGERLLKNIDKVKGELLAAYRPPALAAGLVEDLDRYMLDIGLDSRLLDRLRP